jgi:hypothetical protein
MRLHSCPGHHADEVTGVDLTPHLRCLVCDLPTHGRAGLDRRTTPGPMAHTLT